MKKRWLLFAGLLLLPPIPLLLILPGSWFVGKIENIASAQLGMEVRIGGLELKLLSSTPAAAFSGVSIDDDSGSPLISVGTRHSISKRSQIASRVPFNIEPWL